MRRVDSVEASRKARPTIAAMMARLMAPFEVFGLLTIVDGNIAAIHSFKDLIQPCQD